MTVSADRKVSCDRRFPRCTSCIKSNRKCQGYGLRLSWPKASDGKRSLISRAATSPRANITPGRLHMINATSWDIEVHNFLVARRMIRPIMTYPLPWSSSGSNATDQSLFRFCRYRDSGLSFVNGISDGGPLFVSSRDAETESFKFQQSTLGRSVASDRPVRGLPCWKSLTACVACLLSTVSVWAGISCRGAENIGLACSIFVSY